LVAEARISTGSAAGCREQETEVAAMMQASAWTTPYPRSTISSEHVCRKILPSSSKPKPSFHVMRVRGVSPTCMWTVKPRFGGAFLSFGRRATMAQQHGVQHVTSNYLGAFIGGGTRTQFRCNGTGGWCGRRWQWSRWRERRSRNHRQLKQLAKQYERQQRCSTARRPKQSDWQYCCSTARQYGPK
jgi:hypothetical protein